jgi:hypothetical protein
MKSKNNSMDNILEKEASVFTRYLLDCEPPPDMVESYISANRHLGVNAATAADEHILNFSVSHPWSIPYLDAATGISMNDSLLRKKIYIMAAVLEASPRYSESYLPEPLSPFMFFPRLVASGLKACIKIIIGIPMLMLIRKRADD